jgi:PEGA domain
VSFGVLASTTQMIRRALSVLLSALLVTTPAFAQDDDLVPLTPTAPKAKPKPKPKPPKAKPAPKPAPMAQDDDLVPLTPVGGKTELLVKVAAELQGAKLYIDNKEVGALPMGPQAVSAGEHAVLVKRPGFAPFTKKVNVAQGKTVEISAELKATMAVLNITSEPSGAQVWSSGKSLGVTPLESVEVPPGFVSLVAKKEGHPDAKTDLVAKAGKDHPVSLKLAGAAAAVAARPAPVEDRPEVATLTPDDSVSSSPVTAETQVAPQPIVTRWYFWVGVVAVAGAIAAGTAIGVSQANTTKPLTQQEICGGPCDACINCAAALKF